MGFFWVFTPTSHPKNKHSTSTSTSTHDMNTTSFKRNSPEAGSKVKGFISSMVQSRSSNTPTQSRTNASSLGLSSKGSVATSGASAALVGAAPVGSSTVLTLSQFSSISTPPAGEKLTSSPRRPDWMHR